VPGPGVWAGVVVFAAVVAVAVSVASWTVSAVVGAVVLVVGVVLVLWSSPVVEVVAGELRAGSAHVPLSDLGAVVVLDRAGVGRAMGPAWDARAFACLRTWTGGAIHVEVLDPSDPTPYWIVSSRDAEGLAAAIEGSR
jgi:hypothetical protein